MLYAAARDSIQSGDVIFQSHKPLRSFYDLQVQLVRMFTRSEWSHAALVWAVGGRLFVLEAVSAGVRIFPLSRAGDFTLVRRGGMTTDMEEFALAHVGEPYSKWDAIRSYFGASNDKDANWFCSEFVCAVLGLPVIDKTPAEVMRYLTEFEGLTAQFVSNP
jgi:uncharacterized protein YycO